MALELEHMISGCNFNKYADISTESYRHSDVRAGSFQDVEERLVEPEPIVLLTGLPVLQLDDQVDGRAVAHRGQAEQVLDVDDADAAQLHVVAQGAFAEPDQLAVGIALDRDLVIGHEAVPARNQIEGRLALPYPAVADHQHADPVDFHEHAVHGG